MLESKDKYSVNSVHWMVHYEANVPVCLFWEKVFIGILGEGINTSQIHNSLGQQNMCKRQSSSLP